MVCRKPRGYGMEESKREKTTSGGNGVEEAKKAWKGVIQEGIKETWKVYKVNDFDR